MYIFTVLKGVIAKEKSFTIKMTRSCFNDVNPAPVKSIKCINIRTMLFAQRVCYANADGRRKFYVSVSCSTCMDL